MRSRPWECRFELLLSTFLPQICHSIAYATPSDLLGSYTGRTTRSGRAFSPYVPAVFVNINYEHLLRLRTVEQEQHLSDIDDPDHDVIEDLDDLIQPDDIDDIDETPSFAPSTPQPAVPRGAPSPVPASSLPRHAIAKANKCKKRNLRSHKKRDSDRKAAAAASKLETSVKAVHRRKVTASVPLITSYNASGPLVWTGRRTPWNRKTFSLKDLARLGFRVVHWNGKYVHHRLLFHSKLTFLQRSTTYP